MAPPVKTSRRYLLAPSVPRSHMVEDLAVREVMTREFVGASESDTIRDAAELMLGEDQAAVVVLRGSEPVGMILERQLLSAVLNGHDPDKTRVGTIMGRPPTVLSPETGIAEAAAVLADAKTDHVFIGHGENLIGVLSENDLITAVTSLLTTEFADRFDERIESPQPRTEPEERSEMPSSQSVCENCGSLKYDLEPVDGKLVCADCRDV